MANDAPHSSEVHSYDATDSTAIGWVQVLLGIIPAFFLLIFAQLGMGADATLGIPVFGHRLFFGFCLGVLGFAGLVWGAIPSPKSAAVPIIALLICGFASIGIMAWPASEASESMAVGGPGILVLGAGPILIGCYQCVCAIQRLLYT